MLASRGNVAGGKSLSQPLLDCGLMVARDGASWMSAQISQFDHNTREAAARPFRLCRPFRKVREERVDEFIRLASAWKCAQPLDCQLAGMCEGHPSDHPCWRSADRVRAL